MAIANVNDMWENDCHLNRRKRHYISVKGLLSSASKISDRLVTGRYPLNVTDAALTSFMNNVAEIFNECNDSYLIKTRKIFKSEKIHKRANKLQVKLFNMSFQSELAKYFNEVIISNSDGSEFQVRAERAILRDETLEALDFFSFIINLIIMVINGVISPDAMRTFINIYKQDKF